MFLHSRRVSVWLVSFLMVLVIYFFYNRLNRTPVITTNNAAPKAVQPPQDYDGNNITGKVGQVGVGAAKNVRYTKLNAQKQVAAEFGFEELLHQDGNEWEIEKPVYTIYGKQYKSTLTGDKATVTVETSSGEVSPKQGQLTGNVMIRIWPTRQGSFSPTTVYLDDISFAGDKSLFSTDGFVEIDSNEVQLKGTGLEVVFNGDDQQLEHLKIAKLEKLRLKQPAAQNPADKTPQNNKADNTNKTTGSTGHEYKCLLDRNVVVDTPQERLMADIVSISNFIMSAGGGGKEEDAGHKAEDAGQKTGDGKQNTEQAGRDVDIKCDGGILVVPMESAEEMKTADTQQMTGDEWKKAEEKRNGRTLLCSRQFDYNASTNQAITTGPTQLIFDINSRAQQPATETKTAQESQTVTIVSQKEARFEPASNRAAFSGDCKCTVSKKLPDALQQYIVTAENIEAVLKSRTGNAAEMPDIVRLIAKGGEVRLAGIKKTGSTPSASSPQADQRLLSGVEMKCAQMDYNTTSGDFFATGPGLIKMDNSQTDESQKGLGRFSLRRRCYAFLRNFDSLQFAGHNGHLTADAGDGSMLVDYFPLGDPNSPAVKTAGKPDKISITASHVEADISETPQGRTELAGFTATRAVTYTDKNVDVAGDKFVYDVNDGIIDILGDKNKPLFFNGAIFDAVQYDVKNDKWKTNIKGPGAIR